MKNKLFCILLGICILFTNCSDKKEDLIPEEPPIILPETPEQAKIEDILNISIDNETFTILGCEDWYGVAYGNGKYVAVGDYGNMAHSTNGTNWT